MIPRFDDYTTIGEEFPFFLERNQLQGAEFFAGRIFNIAHDVFHCIMCANIMQSGECLIFLGILTSEIQGTPQV